MKSANTRRSEWLVAILILISTAAALRPLLGAGEFKHKQHAAARYLASGQYKQARILAEELIHKGPDSDFNLAIMAEALAGESKPDQANLYYNQISHTDSRLYILATYGTAIDAFGDGRVRDAERLLKQTLKLNPRHTDASRKLAYLMRIEGRIWESEAPVRELIRQGHIRNDHLSMLGSRAVILDERLFIEKCITAVPDDPLPRLGKATLHLLKNRYGKAESLLTEIIRSAPEILSAQAKFGGLLNDQQRDDEFISWHQALPVDADQHPEIWYVRGCFLSRLRRNDEAARCFIETLTRSPNHVEATYMLSQSLQASGKSELALLTAKRSERLASAETTMSTLAHGVNVEEMKRAAFQLAELERYWEASSMCYLVIDGFSSRETWAESGLQDYIALLDRDVSFKPGTVPVSGLRLKDFPLPDWSRVTVEPKTEVSPPGMSGISFVENASDVGLNFQYFNGSRKPKGLEHIFETTGGGVAVVDIDGDHWPDLWLGQGNSVWSTDNFSIYTDAIFRNIDGSLFRDITQQSFVRETGFSQGVAAGDINSDGFADIYVGNVGPNRLLINNGDGTFSDVTQETGVGGDEWTMSPAIVDLNKDGFPEIYSLNYLNRDEVLVKSCRKNGEPMTCAPTMFTAEQDRLYQNLGDGRLTEVTQSCGIVRDAGNGLGLVAADFDGSGRISLFIGNDTTNNFFFRNVTRRDGRLTFKEEALLMGLACDGLGKAQATMGIAADDCNGDGSIDLFITNFYGDANTFFQSESAGSWSDQTRRAQLFNSSVEKLGFGCQFLDADLDGWPDLIITNGHVDRSDATQEPDKMRPQFYRNLSGKFDELPATSVGQFFDQKHLGRALSTLDWNRDGKPDCCISHLFTPAALLTNTSIESGHFFRIRPIGVTVDRDAIGTIITVEADGQAWTKQVTLGHGYESTNEHVLTFGLGKSEHIDQVKVRWTSDVTTVLNDLPTDADVTIIEGKNGWSRNPATQHVLE
jgi:tetratricopeptide (TPR) repeat protein